MKVSISFGVVVVVVVARRILEWKNKATASAAASHQSLDCSGCELRRSRCSLAAAQSARRPLAATPPTGLVCACAAPSIGQMFQSSSSSSPPSVRSFVLRRFGCKFVNHSYMGAATKGSVVCCRLVIPRRCRQEKEDLSLGFWVESVARIQLLQSGANRANECRMANKFTTCKGSG